MHEPQNALIALRNKAKTESCEITADEIGEAYERQKGKGPCRKVFFPSSHRSENARQRGSNRHEEQLAKAFVRLKKMTLSDGTSLRFFDYQVPLKSVRGDKGVGKIDLVGCVDEQSLALIELKKRAKIGITRAEHCLKS
jgi:hypothetical protein